MSLFIILTFAIFHQRKHKVQMSLIWTKLVDPMQERPWSQATKVPLKSSKVIRIKYMSMLKLCDLSRQRFKGFLTSRLRGWTPNLLTTFSLCCCWLPLTVSPYTYTHSSQGFNSARHRNKARVGPIRKVLTRTTRQASQHYIHLW